MYYLILTLILWRQDAASAQAAPTIQTLEFRDETACRKAALAWKASVNAARPPPDTTGRHPVYALSAQCVASDSTSRIK